MICKFPQCVDAENYGPCLNCGEVSHKTCFNNHIKGLIKQTVSMKDFVCGIPCFRKHLKDRIAISDDSIAKASYISLVKRIEAKGNLIKTNNNNKGKILQRYTIKFKKEALISISNNNWSASKASKNLNIPSSTLSDWMKNSNTILNSGEEDDRFKSKGAGRKTILYFENDLLKYAESMRAIGRPVQTSDLVDYIQNHEVSFFTNYKNENKSIKSLDKLCRRFAQKHGITLHNPKTSESI